MRPAARADRDGIAGILSRSFGSARLVSRGTLHDALAHRALVVEERQRLAAVAVYFHEEGATELLALVSEVPRSGHGSRLVEEVARRARRRGSSRLLVTTTDDNLDALGFYEARGFRVVERRRGAVEGYRRLKPEIPLLGAGGRPIKDEIVLERTLAPGSHNERVEPLSSSV